MIKVEVPFGSIVYDNSYIITPSSKIWAFQSSGSGRNFGYYMTEATISKEMSDKIYVQGYVVKGEVSDIVTSIFGATHNEPVTIY